MRKVIITSILYGFDQKNRFFEGWSWLKFNNFGLALGTNLKFYTSVEKGLKVKVRMFLGLVKTFVEVTREKLVGGPFCPPSWIGLSDSSDIRTHNHLVRNHYYSTTQPWLNHTLNHYLAKLAKLIFFSKDRAVLWVFICAMHLTVCYYVTYAFQSESTHYSCLNIKEILVRTGTVEVSLTAVGFEATTLSS